jgi:glycosyltransferase involved in cell wall biosynthesis
MDRHRVAILIPALNESETIAKVVRLANKYGTTIVIDDGSSDKTPKLALEEGAFVISNKKNWGYDFSLNAGFKKAIELDAEIIITIDADGQHDPQLISKFINSIDAGADLVLGVRNRFQRISEHIFGWYTSLRFGIKDPLCGLKAYKNVTFNALGFFDSYESIGTQLMLTSVKAGFKFSQIPVDVQDRRGASRFGARLRGNYKILRAMIFCFLYAKYPQKKSD